MKIEFAIPGNPFGKQRPRITVRGGYGHAYTPKQTVEYEKTVRTLAMEQVIHSPEWRTDYPMAVRIRAFYPIPESFPKKKRQLAESGELLPMVKPDLDNVNKAIMDAMNEIVYQDDKQICALFSNKQYSDNPRVVVTVAPIVKGIG